jgi:hypothetical protein
MTTLSAQSHIATASSFVPSTTSRARTVALWATQIVVAGMSDSPDDIRRLYAEYRGGRFARMSELAHVAAAQ